MCLNKNIGSTYGISIVIYWSTGIFLKSQPTKTPFFYQRPFIIYKFWPYPTSDRADIRLVRKLRASYRYWRSRFFRFRTLMSRVVQSKKVVWKGLKTPKNDIFRSKNVIFQRFFIVFSHFQNVIFFDFFLKFWELLKTLKNRWKITFLDRKMSFLGVFRPFQTTFLDCTTLLIKLRNRENGYVRHCRMP